MRWLLIPLLMGCTGCLGSGHLNAPTHQDPAAGSRAAPRKLALLIGIGHYYQFAAHSGQRPWGVLHVQKELAEYQQVLIRDYGFLPDDVRVLLDEQGTAANIRTAVQEHLIRQARPGDIVLFHYSGHGQQIPDDADPALRDEPDGLDESLVPYDAVDQSIAEGLAKNIRDDEVGQWLDVLADRVSPLNGRQGHITVTLDTCFSGSATRGSLVARGRSWDPSTDGPLPLRQPLLPQEGAVGLLPANQAPRRNVVVVAASRPDQSAWEKNGGGVFTRHWVRLLANVQPAAMPTYAAALDKLAIEIAAEGIDQSPQLEGASANLLFSGLARPAVRPHDAVRVLRGEPGVFWLQAGEIHGVSEGSIYRLHEAGAARLDSTTTLGEAKVSAVTPFAARLELLSGSRLGERPGALAIETHHAYAVTPIRAILTGFDPIPGLRQTLAELDLLNVIPALAAARTDEDDYDIELRYVKSSNRIDILRPTSGVPAKTIALALAQPEDLTDWLRAEWRRGHFTRLQRENVDARVELELVPVDAQLNSHGHFVCQSVPLASPVSSSHLKLAKHKCFGLRLHNRSAGPLYAAVLGISPDGAIDLLFPTEAGDNRLAAGQLLEPPLRNTGTQLIGDPGDRVVIKVIATDVFVDLRGAVSGSNQNASRGGPQVVPAGLTYRPLQRLLESLGSGTRGHEAVLQPTRWGTTDASVTIEP